MFRRNFIGNLVAGGALAHLSPSSKPEVATDIFLERPATGQPHKGKVLLALQAHSDDIALEASGTVANLIEGGYIGYLVRATYYEVGDSHGLGTQGPVGTIVLGGDRVR